MNDELCFDDLFREADKLIQQFTSTPVPERSKLNKTVFCPIPEKKFKDVFRGISTGNQDSRLKNLKPIKNDYKKWEEVKAFIELLDINVKLLFF